VGIRNLSPKLRNIADNQIDCGVANEKSCGTAIADLQNLTFAILQLSAVSCQFCYFLVPFPQLRMVKINQKYLCNCLFLWKQKLALKGQLHEIFTSNFFFMNQLDSKAKNMPKIAEVKLSSGGFKVSDFRKNCNCRVAVAEQHFFKSCGIVFEEVLPSTCGIVIADS
jgi:hypothetical protein